jgi:mRNA interferase MazF
MTKYFRGNIFWAYYPYDDEEYSDKLRPVIVFDEEENLALVIKVTSQGKRDETDLEIIHWQKAGLPKPSVARMSKLIIVPEEDMRDYIGTLHEEDQIDVLELYYKLYSE